MRMGYSFAMRKPCYTHISIAERETLSLGLAQGYWLRTVASVLGRAPSRRAANPRATQGATRIEPATRSTWRWPGRGSLGDHAHSWTRGSGSMSGPT